MAVRQCISKQCERCGTEFSTKRDDQRFCGIGCSQRYVAELEQSKRTRATCKHCGVEFAPKHYDRTTFCSRECSFKARAKAPASCPVWFRKCPICEATFCARRKNRTVCYVHTEKEWNAWNMRQRFVPIAERRGVVERTCPHCGEMFNAQHLGRLYCSDECGGRANRREAKHRRRARGGNYVAAVHLAWLIERDGARCQICGKKVKREATVPHPLAPTIDHIVPLSCGGKHERENVQLAHFRCNSMKGNRGGGQMRLMA